jgi:glyoxylase-like metal-dependent hydrolase (beta-lactamase superfamily II)/8-oxo-dGTP pyrophosphatase MutT (NUDIX family)
MGGFVAFPGGKVHSSDIQSNTDPRRIAAVREIFEETGVLLARLADGSFPSAGETLNAFRQQLLDENIGFSEILAKLQARIDPRDLKPAGSLTTPPFAAMRFDTSFFIAQLPPGQEAHVWPGELSAGSWQTAANALNAWEQGQILLSPPTVSLLEAVRGRPIDDLPERIRPLIARVEGGALHPIYFSPGVLMLPLFCQGLPTTPYTNAFLIGTGPKYLVDPGPTDPGEQARLFAILDDNKADAILLTHHHPDHIGAAVACSNRYGLPIWAHEDARRYLPEKIKLSRTLNEGDRLPLGQAPHGRGPWHLEVIHTPGHTPDHVAFYEPSYQLLIVGDMLSTISSVVIVPPEGNLADYLASLHRLQGKPARLLFPGHGPVSARPGKVLEDALNHRTVREKQLLDALGPGKRTVEDLATEIYRGLPADLMELARLQTLAGLYKLRDEGLAEQAGEGWRSCATPFLS